MTKQYIHTLPRDRHMHACQVPTATHSSHPKPTHQPHTPAPHTHPHQPPNQPTPTNPTHLSNDLHPGARGGCVAADPLLLLLLLLLLRGPVGTEGSNDRVQHGGGKGGTQVHGVAGVLLEVVPLLTAGTAAAAGAGAVGAGGGGTCCCCTLCGEQEHRHTCATECQSQDSTCW